MKKFILTTLALLAYAGLSAQNGITFLMGKSGKNDVLIIVDDKAYPCDTLDRIMMRVNYSYSFVKDTTSGYTEKGTGTLEIGRNYTKYYDGLLFKADSLVRNRLTDWYSGTFDKASVDQLTLKETFIHNLKSNEWICTGRVVTQDFKYKDNTEDMKWEILDSTATVSGYNAVMARCSFRGRDYVAWFTPDIPASAGPWKFSGLPGLILSVTDTEGYFKFEADNLYTTGGCIYLTDYLYLNTKREKYMEARKLFETRKAVARQRYWVNADIIWEPTKEALKSFTPLGNDYMEKDL